MRSQSGQLPATLMTLMIFAMIFLPLAMFIAAYPNDWNKAVSVWSAVLVTVVMVNATFYMLYTNLNAELP